MPVIFSDFYSGVEFDIRQRADYLTGSESDDLAKPLPSGQAMRITNEAIVSLLRRVPASRAAVPLTHTFTVHTNILDMSDAVLTIAAVKSGLDWHYLDNPFVRNRTGINSAGDSAIHNENGWVPGDKIEMLVVMHPKEITEDSDIIDFPMSFMELLRKEVVMQAASIVNLEVSQLYLMRYSELLNEYVSSQRIRSRAVIKNMPGGRVVNRGKR